MRALLFHHLKEDHGHEWLTWNDANVKNKFIIVSNTDSDNNNNNIIIVVNLWQELCVHVAGFDAGIVIVKGHASI